MTIKTAALLIAAAITLAPTASAGDDQAFINDLQTAGVPLLFGPNMITGGYKACALLRNGASRDLVISQVGPHLNAFGPVIIDAAQHHLCPDTLH